MQSAKLEGFARRLPDPIYNNVQRHIFQCRVLDLPTDLPRDPNPRNQKINRSIWRDIKQHLLNDEGTPNTFHLKNKGITIIASGVEKIGNDRFKLILDDGDGIVDGAHTYKLLIENRDQIEDQNSAGAEIDQYIKVEVLTGLPRKIVTEIAGGLNTGLQVQEFSLANQRGEFDWIRDELKDEPYFDDIAFRENEDAVYDVRDIISMLFMFNVFKFPRNSTDQPIRAYSSKTRVLNHFLNNQDQYKRLRPLLKNILVLHDTISYEARDLHNQAGGHAAALTFVNSRQRGSYKFPIVDEAADHSLHRGALYPMLAAFRWFVAVDDNNVAGWSPSFDAVLETWRDIAPRLMQATKETCNDLGRKANAIGRNRNHWSNLYSTVGLHVMQKQHGKLDQQSLM